MKKIIIHSLIATVALGTYSFAYADTDINVNAQVKAKAEVKIEEKRPERGIFSKVKSFVQNKIEFRNSSSIKYRKENDEKMEREDKENNKIGVGSLATRLQSFKAMLSHMVERFQATIDRENKITERISSRIEKIKSAGGNTTESEKIVAEAKIKFTDAKTTLNNLKLVIDTEISANASTTATSTTNTTPLVKESLEKIRKSAQTVKEDLKAGHSLLIKAVVNLRRVSGTISNTNTTATVNISN